MTRATLHAIGHVSFRTVYSQKAAALKPSLSSAWLLWANIHEDTGNADAAAKANQRSRLRRVPSALLRGPL